MPKANTDTRQFVRAQFVPDTLNQEERTVNVVFATPTPVLRYSWMREEYYNEVLDMNGANLERTSKGLPVLDNHSSWGSVGTTVIGRAHDIKREGESWTATVRFSKRENVQGLIDDVRDGIITDISFGYSVDKVERMEKTDGEQYRTYMVRNWTPNEISFVSIPADPKAGVRSADGQTKGLDLVEIYERENPTPEPTKQILNKGVIMKREQIIAMLEKRGITVDASITDDALQAELERALNVEGNDPKAITAAVEAERSRTAEIFNAVRLAKLPNEFAESLVKDGTSIDAARAAILTEFGKSDAGRGMNPHVEVGTDHSAVLRTQAATASLIMRSEPELLRGEKKPFSDEVIAEAGKKYRHMSLVDLAKDSLVRGGVDVDGMDKMQLVGRAFTSSTSDFPVLLEGANRTVLLANYQAQSDTWRRFCATGSVSDFREHKRLRMGTFSDLDKVNENGEFKNKKITDANFEKVKIGTKGNIINVSRQMIINDDLGAFLRLAAMLGRSAARSIENDVYALLASNPTLADGVALFHASHGNIATAGAPSVAVIDAMRQKMASQKDKDSNDFLDIRPALALAPLSLGGSLRLLNTSQFDNDGTAFQKPNIVAGLFNDVIDTPRLAGTTYYMFADPSVEPVIEVNFLNGEQNPFMENENGFSVDGTQWKIRLDYGVGAVGFRGAVRNAGA